LSADEEEQVNNRGKTDLDQKDKIRKLAELRGTLDKRVSELETELHQLKLMLDFVNSTLLEKGFRKPEMSNIAESTQVGPSLEAEEPEGSHVEMAKSAPASEPVLEHEHTRGIPIRTAFGDLLATLYVDEESMHLVLARDKDFTVDTPPFMAFLVERVLARMQEKDRELVQAGEITPDQVLSYEMIKDGEVLRELTVKNAGADRSRELKSTMRWTLEKMFEKMKQTGSEQ
jgi:hypothetical protein